MTKNALEIEEFIEEYRDFLATNDIDVAQSAIGILGSCIRLKKNMTIMVFSSVLPL